LGRFSIFTIYFIVESNELKIQNLEIERKLPTTASDRKKIIRQMISNMKKEIQESRTRLTLLTNIKDEYEIKIEHDKESPNHPSWVHYYEALLYAHRITCDDFYKKYRGNVARKFCEIYLNHLRPWLSTNHDEIRIFDMVSQYFLNKFTV
jgi:hypothetical protein